MNAVRVETTVEADGELHLTDLPCRRGDKVEAIVLILEPLKPTAWPEHFFENIRIDDPAFARPDQGLTPPAPVLD